MLIGDVLVEEVNFQKATLVHCLDRFKQGQIGFHKMGFVLCQPTQAASTLGTLIGSPLGVRSLKALEPGQSA